MISPYNQSLSILLATIKFPIGVAIIKSKSTLVISIPNKPIKDTKTKYCVELRLVIVKPIRQFRIKERIGIIPNKTKTKT